MFLTERRRPASKTVTENVGPTAQKRRSVFVMRHPPLHFSKGQPLLLVHSSIVPTDFLGGTIPNLWLRRVIPVEVTQVAE